MNRATTLASASLLLLAGVAAASDLLVAGPSGTVYRGDPVTGGFETLIDAAPNAGETQAMIVDGGMLYLADGARVRIHNLRFGAEAGGFAVAGGINSMTLDGDTLLVGLHDRPEIVRLARDTGAFIEAYPLQSFDDVHAMTMDQGEVVFGGHTTFVYRRDIDQGVTFLTACGGAVDSVVVVENAAFLGTLTGRLYKVNSENGAYYAIFNFDEGQSALVAHDGDVLTGALSGTIRRVNANTGAVEGSFAAPEGVTAMVVTEIGCPADLDGNGALNVFDFLAFQNAFGEQDRSADADGNGLFDVFDFLTFQSFFGQGC